ncbi:MAG: NAD(P)-dependent dehydrogenase (short-subunit alcohol dehydrogenase family) [Cryomorphaceae bacterium]|jgi:NAD(P)-dependent dehydrogenase (short-subunit alcohol dehydrogenase family)
MKNALIIGSGGSIGKALVEHLQSAYAVSELSRENCDYTESSLSAHADRLGRLGHFDLVICCIGVLHNDLLSPEKRLSELDPVKMLEYYRVNAVLPGLCLKIFTPLLKRPVGDLGISKFVVLSAMVGSIEDNKLGGWYGYRSSKAALNMLLKTAAIEIGRINKRAALVAMHPGTTIGALSRPFAGGVSKDKYYLPEESAARIVSVAESLDEQSNGSFLNWDGSTLAW